MKFSHRRFFLASPFIAAAFTVGLTTADTAFTVAMAGSNTAPRVKATAENTEQLRVPTVEGQAILKAHAEFKKRNPRKAGNNESSALIWMVQQDIEKELGREPTLSEKMQLFSQKMAEISKSGALPSTQQRALVRYYKENKIAARDLVDPAVVAATETARRSGAYAKLSDEQKLAVNWTVAGQYKAQHLVGVDVAAHYGVITIAEINFSEIAKMRGMTYDEVVKEMRDAGDKNRNRKWKEINDKYEKHDPSVYSAANAKYGAAGARGEYLKSGEYDRDYHRQAMKSLSEFPNHDALYEKWKKEKIEAIASSPEVLASVVAAFNQNRRIEQVQKDKKEEFPPYANSTEDRSYLVFGRSHGSMRDEEKNVVARKILNDRTGCEWATGKLEIKEANPSALCSPMNTPSMGSKSATAK